MSDNFDIDPAIAAAMGFSGFGTQPNKKRKFNTNEGFVDPEIGKPKAAGTGANEVPVRERPSIKAADTETNMQASTSTAAATAATASEKPSLQALRHGVRNERGDVAYFLPSFVEDPWKGLEAQ